MSESFDNFLNTAGQALKVAPDLYNDGLKPTVQETGKFIARIPKAINAAFSSLDIWIANKEYNSEETKLLLAKKLENIDPEKIVSPEPYVAVPALQAISYSMNSDELRELYSNLLANSMNSDKKTFVHPAFVEIIKQLSPLDATNLKLIFKKKCCPIVNYYVHSEDSEKQQSYKKNVFLENSSCTDIDLSSVSITNLFRLSLIEIDFSKHIHDSFYDKFLEHPLFTELQNLCTKAKIANEQLLINGCCSFETIDSLSLGELHIPSIEKGLVQMTPLGKSFTEMCIN
ncbi:DUF4393 domain-containing protein [Clostridium botulinum]|nr:DUF4393 domain-containing protein [Clostridium botulinum]NFJ73817.1 DUF4393 domain-containing protein [Clostridium botulinum]NFN61299.1 DUF4393 domain-containing protein [Clostridium botulinum]